MASSGMPKKVSDHVPYCRDQGIDYLAGAGKSGVSVQSLTVAMPNGGVIVFADNGLENMANGLYQVIVHNHTDVADEATVAVADRLVTQITVAGPDDDDVLDIVLVGAIAGQLS